MVQVSLKSNVYTATEVKALKLLLLETRTSAYKEHLMDQLSSSERMHIITKFKLNCSFTMLTTVTFVSVHTFSLHGDSGLHIERIAKDKDFWCDCVLKAEAFFRICILPELLGKWYSRHTPTNPSIQSDSNLALSSCDCSSKGSKLQQYCYCQGPEEVQMIACENVACKIEWFHMKCLKITTAPRGKWYCPDCRKLPQFSRKRSKVRCS